MEVVEFLLCWVIELVWSRYSLDGGGHLELLFDLDWKWLILKHVKVSLAIRCQILKKIVDLCCRARCLDPILCSHAFGCVLVMVQRCKLDIHRCVPVVGLARVEARGRLICLRGTGRRVQGHRMVVVRLVLPIWRCVQRVERGAQSIGFCGCQGWLGLLMELRDELIVRFVLVPYSWSRLCVLLYLCFHWIRKQRYGLQTSCLWIGDIAICAFMCLNLPRHSVSRAIVAHLRVAPFDKCVYVFVHVSARSQGTDICLY